LRDALTKSSAAKWSRKVARLRASKRRSSCSVKTFWEKKRSNQSATTKKLSAHNRAAIHTLTNIFVSILKGVHSKK
jgi:hypothetical protein